MNQVESFAYKLAFRREQSLIYLVVENKHDCVKKSHQCLVQYRVTSHQVQFEKRPIYVSNLLILLKKLRFLFVFGTVAVPKLIYLGPFEHFLVFALENRIIMG